MLPSDCAGQNLKKEAAADIRMHTVVLIPATLTHTGVASKSNQGRREAAQIDYALISVVFPLISFLSQQTETEGLRVYKEL